MDSLTRWSIGLGVGAFLGMAVLGANYWVTAEAKDESFGQSLRQIGPEAEKLDAVIEYDSFDIPSYADVAQLLQDADAERYISCGGYGNPAHVCYIDATIPDALQLSGSNADVIRGAYALTVAEYHSEYDDILEAAGTVLVDTGNGPRPVTYEGNGTFTLGFLAKNTAETSIEPWRFTVAAVPPAALWLAVGALASIVTVLATAAFRPSREPQIETVGVEFFDENPEG